MLCQSSFFSWLSSLPAKASCPSDDCLHSCAPFWDRERIWLDWRHANGAFLALPIGRFCNGPVFFSALSHWFVLVRLDWVSSECDRVKTTTTVSRGRPCFAVERSHVNFFSGQPNNLSYIVTIFVSHQQDWWWALSGKGERERKRPFHLKPWHGTSFATGWIGLEPSTFPTLQFFVNKLA